MNAHLERRDDAEHDWGGRRFLTLRLADTARLKEKDASVLFECVFRKMLVMFMILNVPPNKTSGLVWILLSAFPEKREREHQTCRRSV